MIHHFDEQLEAMEKHWNMMLEPMKYVASSMSSCKN